MLTLAQDDKTMDSITLHKHLEAKGILARLQPGFRGMISGIDSNDRIVCAQREDEQGLYGPSFWLYGGGETWYLGLWSGAVFSIPSPDSIVQLAEELWTTITSNFQLPDGFAEKHGLKQLPD